MIPNKSGRLLVTVIEAVGGGGGGGGEGGGGEGQLAKSINYDNEKIEETSKEKHSLTRKLVGYRNWRQM